MTTADEYHREDSRQTISDAGPGGIQRRYQWIYAIAVSMHVSILAILVNLESVFYSGPLIIALGLAGFALGVRNRDRRLIAAAVLCICLPPIVCAVVYWNQWDRFHMQRPFIWMGMASIALMVPFAGAVSRGLYADESYATNSLTRDWLTTLLITGLLVTHLSWLAGLVNETSAIYSGPAIALVAFAIFGLAVRRSDRLSMIAAGAMVLFVVSLIASPPLSDSQLADASLLDYLGFASLALVVVSTMSAIQNQATLESGHGTQLATGWRPTLRKTAAISAHVALLAVLVDVQSVFYFGPLVVCAGIAVLVSALRSHDRRSIPVAVAYVFLPTAICGLAYRYQWDRFDLQEPLMYLGMVSLALIVPGVVFSLFPRLVMTPCTTGSAGEWEHRTMLAALVAGHLGLVASLNEGSILYLGGLTPYLGIVICAAGAITLVFWILRRKLPFAVSAASLLLLGLCLERWSPSAGPAFEYAVVALLGVSVSARLFAMRHAGAGSPQTTAPA